MYLNYMVIPYRFLLACISCNNVILQHFAWDSLSIIGEKVCFNNHIITQNLNENYLLVINIG